MGIPELLVLIREVVREVPATKWALVVVALVAVLAIIDQLKIGRKFAFFGLPSLVIAMSLLLVFSAASTFEHHDLEYPAKVIIWAAVAIFVTAAICTLTSLFWNFPAPLQHWISPGRRQWKYACPYLGGTWERLAQDRFGRQLLHIVQEDLNFRATMDTPAGYEHVIQGSWNDTNKEYDVITTRTTSNPLPALAEKGDSFGCTVQLFGRYVPQEEGRFIAYCDRTSGSCGLSESYRERGTFVRIPDTGSSGIR